MTELQSLWTSHDVSNPSSLKLSFLRCEFICADYQLSFSKSKRSKLKHLALISVFEAKNPMSIFEVAVIYEIDKQLSDQSPPAVLQVLLACVNYHTVKPCRALNIGE